MAVESGGDGEMLISIEAAVVQLEIKKEYIYHKAYKYHTFIVYGKGRDRKFNITAYNEAENKKQKEIDFCIDMVNFSEFVISMLDEEEFYSKIPRKRRKDVKRGFTSSKFPLPIAEMIHETFSEWLEDYENYEELGDAETQKDQEQSQYVPFKQREPLTKKYLLDNYWSRGKTAPHISKELNVPEQWVRDEIKRLGMQKKENGIRLTGRKGFKMSKEQKKKRENQPHAKPVVQICPKSFAIVAEYNSQGAVERYGFRRENVRKSIKNGGLHKNYLWAFKGMEKAVISVAIKRGNIDKKLQALNYKQPTKQELKDLYITANMTTRECSEIFKCHPTTIAILASRYGLKKRTGKISADELRKLYIDQGLKAKEIANITGYKKSSISTYLNRYGIKRGV